MTGWHLLKLWGAIAAVVIGAAGGLLLWPLVWPADPDRAPALVNGRLVGETEGYVWRVESDKQRIHVTSSVLGLRAVPITVTADTKIVVDDKLGGLGDIWKGMDVRVSYEMHDSARIATAVELLTTKTRRARSTPTEVVVPPPTPPPAAQPAPAPLSRPAQRPSPPAQVSRPAAAPKPAETRPSARATASQPSEPDASDGSAAVDWLFRSSRR